MNLLLKNPLSRFLIAIFLFYLAWYLVYDLWIHPHSSLDMSVINLTIDMSRWILEGLGYDVFTGAERVIGVDGTGGLWIGDNCNAISLFATFTGFILAYPGNWKKKAWYIPAGVLIIHVLNVIRMCSLAILDTYSRKWTEFNHTYTFNIIIYGCIFLMWMHWTEKVADNSLFRKTGKA